MVSPQVGTDTTIIGQLSVVLHFIHLELSHKYINFNKDVMDGYGGSLRQSDRLQQCQSPMLTFPQSPSTAMGKHNVPQIVDKIFLKKNSLEMQSTTAVFSVFQMQSLDHKSVFFYLQTR